MITFPNCKINLGLRITRKRPDGFHDLETVFYPLPLFDVLETLPSKKLEIHHSGLPIPGNKDKNLCVQACMLLKEEFPTIPELEIWLHKHIPIGSGLGGGSSDATHLLLLVNEQFELGLSPNQLFNYALRLGSDCPFFLINKPCVATGRGELLEEIPLDLSSYSFVLVNPGIHVDTGWAFSQSKPLVSGGSIKDMVTESVINWKSILMNDFEKPVIGQYPELKKIKDKLYQEGALYVSMTGSGSSFYGIFNKGEIPSFSFEEKYSTIIIP